jgi:hypothetical protein
VGGNGIWGVVGPFSTTSATLFFNIHFFSSGFGQSYEIKSPPWTILWFRILGIFSFENIDRLGVFKFETSKHPTYLYFQQGKGPPSRQA